MPKTPINKPAPSRQPNGSYVRIECSDDAAYNQNILILNSDSKTKISLKPGWNLLTASQYPDLKYGFCPDVFQHNRVFELNPNCQSILEIDLSHFDASEVRSTESMCSDMVNLKKIDLSNVKFSKVQTMDFMFSRCFNLEEVVTNRFDTFVSKELESAESMFFLASKLKKLSLPYLVHNKVKNIRDIFMGMTALEALDISGWDLRGVKIGNVGGEESMFHDNQALQKVYAIGCNKITREKLLQQRDELRGNFCIILALNIKGLDFASPSFQKIERR